MDQKKERSTSSTFLFNENKSSSSIHKDFESPTKPNQSRRNNFRRSYSSPSS
jgi:hypothetical protein